MPTEEGAADRGIPQQNEVAEDMPRKPLRPGESVRRIAIRKAGKSSSTRVSAERFRFALKGTVDKCGGAARPPPTVGRMDDEGFWAPGNRCERCGGDYDLVTVRTACGPAMVEVCPRCDLGVLELAPRHQAADGSVEPFSTE